ncbi:MAG: alpha/beta hydrolase [Candidatus Moranbacteria bacterium]|nr:alpha/beta hydrolase [Candidatus Moranbacteria bacterium]
MVTTKNISLPNEIVLIFCVFFALFLCGTALAQAACTVPPTVDAASATDVLDNKATLNAIVERKSVNDDCAITYKFEVWKTATPGQTQTVGGATVPVSSQRLPVSTPVSGLDPNTQYAFKAIVTVASLGVTAEGATRNFTTRTTASQCTATENGGTQTFTGQCRTIAQGCQTGEFPVDDTKFAVTGCASAALERCCAPVPTNLSCGQGDETGTCKLSCDGSTETELSQFNTQCQNVSNQVGTCCKSNSATTPTTTTCQDPSSVYKSTCSASDNTSGLVPCGRQCDNPDTADIDESAPCTLCHLILGIQLLVKWGMFIVTVIAVSVVVIAGIIYIISAGNQSMMTLAKQAIVYALAGFAIVLGAWVIINTIFWILVGGAANQGTDTSSFLSRIGLSGKNWYTFTCDQKNICTTITTTTTPTVTPGEETAPTDGIIGFPKPLLKDYYEGQKESATSVAGVEHQLQINRWPDRAGTKQFKGAQTITVTVKEIDSNSIQFTNPSSLAGGGSATFTWEDGDGAPKIIIFKVLQDADTSDEEKTVLTLSGDGVADSQNEYTLRVREGAAPTTEEEIDPTKPQLRVCPDDLRIDTNQKITLSLRYKDPGKGKVSSCSDADAKNATSGVVWEVYNGQEHVTTSSLTAPTVDVTGKSKGDVNIRATFQNNTKNATVKVDGGGDDKKGGSNLPTACQELKAYLKRLGEETSTYVCTALASSAKCGPPQVVPGIFGTFRTTRCLCNDGSTPQKIRETIIEENEDTVRSNVDYACVGGSDSDGGNDGNGNGKTPALTYKDITYSKQLGLDVYPATSQKTSNPVVVYIHSGGWFKGSKSSDDGVLIPSDLSQKGVNVVSIDYTLVSNGYYPEPLEDVDCALRWVAENASKYGFDTQNVYMGGYSSGAHLALLSSFRPGTYRGTSCVAQEASRPQVKKVFSLAAPSDLTTINGSVRTMSNNFLHGASATEASPLTYAGTSNGSQYLLVHAKDDELVSFSTQALPLQNKLTPWNVSGSYMWLNSGGHLFAFSRSAPAYNSVINAISNFLK